MISDRLKPFGTTIFAEMTHLAEVHEAINLSQGFPDFAGPRMIIDAAERAMRDGEVQYARSRGHRKLVHAIAASRKRDRGIELDPLTEITVFSGATEGIAAAMLGLVNPGDDVILFEPAYDSYPATTAMAGGVARYVPLSFPEFRIEEAAVRAAVTDRTRLIVLNSPMNPTGRVFTREELAVVARIARERDLLVLADEVYEHLVFDGNEHVPISTLPGMRERTLTLSSAGKTFSFTGFKIGWGMGPPDLIDAVQAAHQFLTFAVATPLQVAVAEALQKLPEDYYREFCAAYTERRDFLVAALREAGFTVRPPEGTYFVLADFSEIFDGDDRAFAEHLVKEHRIATIPPSPFWVALPEKGRKLIRFAFCKRMETLKAAAERLRRLRP